jgi:hypothetical protein
MIFATIIAHDFFIVIAEVIYFYGKCPMIGANHFGDPRKKTILRLTNEPIEWKHINDSLTSDRPFAARRHASLQRARAILAFTCE